jgi:hypothetical protein
MREEIVKISSKVPVLTAITHDWSARFLRLEFVEWIQMLPPEDMNYADIFCIKEPWSPLDSKVIKLPALYDKIRTLHPHSKQIHSLDDRFKTVIKRRDFAEHTLLLNAPLILSVHTELNAPQSTQIILRENRRHIEVKSPDFMQVPLCDGSDDIGTAPSIMFHYRKWLYELKENF